MSDPSTDKIGTVRQSPDGTIVVRAENESYPWMALNLDGPYCAPNEVVATWPVIGACPGTPAVEGRGMDDAAEVERLKDEIDRLKGDRLTARCSCGHAWPETSATLLVLKGWWH